MKTAHIHSPADQRAIENHGAIFPWIIGRQGDHHFVIRPGGEQVDGLATYHAAETLVFNDQRRASAEDYLLPCSDYPAPTDD